MEKTSELVDIGVLLQDDTIILDAIRRGGMEAMKMYIQADKPMASWRDGKVYMIPPEELKTMLAEAELKNTPTS